MNAAGRGAGAASRESTLRTAFALPCPALQVSNSVGCYCDSPPQCCQGYLYLRLRTCTSIGRAVGRAVGRLAGWLVGWSAGWLAGRPVGRLAGCWSLAGPRVGWSICSPPARLVGSLVTDTAPAITCVGPVCMGLRAWGVRAALERFLVCGPSYVGRLLRVNWTREVHSATFRTLTANRACAYRNRATVFCEHEFRGSGRAGLARPLFRDKP